jgi:hypothetical protein
MNAQRLAVALVSLTTGMVVLASSGGADAASPAPTATSVTMPMRMASSTPAPEPNAAEAAFVASVTSTLLQRYPTTVQAQAAGYYQMTKMEDDGTVIWFNDDWGKGVSKDAPNFLWFDKAGKLVGLDYQYVVALYPQHPGANVYPVMASRWSTIDAHMHFAYKLLDGTIVRRGARALKGATGDPTAAQLTAAKLLPAGATLLWAHYHPKSWDLGFWLVPNPNGAFADLNPLVKP